MLMIYGLIAIGFLVVVILAYYFSEGKCDLKKAKEEFEIFGLSDGFVPQGFCYAKSLNCFLMSGYMGNHKSASRIYVIDAETKKLIKFVYVKQDYKKLSSHFGGITSFGADVWISSEGEVLRLKIEDIKNAKNEGSVSVFDSFMSQNGSDFCFVHSGLLWIGEFYKLGKFNTNIAHHIKINNKIHNHAMCYGFKISSQNLGGVEKLVPEKALSVPDMVQGICVFGNKLYVSTSYGISKSSLSVYENVLNKPEDSHTYFGNKKIPLYILTREKLIHKYVLPSMSEEIEAYSERVFVLFESAAKKYRIFTRRKTKEIFSFSVHNIK